MKKLIPLLFLFTVTISSAQVQVTNIEDNPEKEEREAYLDLYEALDKMRSRTANINHRIIEYFQLTTSDMTLYLFFTIPNDRPNYGCVTTLTPYGRGEPISVDCKSLYTKVAQWNAIPGSPKIY